MNHKRQNIKIHYQNLFDKHGDAPESVQYSNTESQLKRFEILFEIDKNMSSLIDMGCGLAHLYDYLISKKFNGKYLGLDFVPEFIEADKLKFKNDSQASFMEFDIIKQEIPEGYDFVLLSGVFNNKMNNNKDFMLNGITKMFKSCKKGVAFNAMSTYVDFQAEDLYYSNPLEVFDFCKRNLTKKVALRHDYLVKKNSIPFEYAIYLYK